MSKTSKYWKVSDRRFPANQYCAFSQLPLSECYQVGRAEYFRLGKADYLPKIYQTFVGKILKFWALSEMAGGLCKS